MRTITKAAALAAATIALTAGGANAYTMDAAGYGFVGKGEVQTPFGWNNKDLQTNADGVTFSLDQTTAYTAVCTFTTGEGTPGEKVHNVSHAESTAINSTVVNEPRKNSSGKDGSVTGFFLNGLGETTEGGDEVPVVGGPCPGNAGHGGTWSSVEEGETVGGLYANFDGVSHLLTPTPVL